MKWPHLVTRGNRVKALLYKEEQKREDKEHIC